jgi:hypothetical protein
MSWLKKAASAVGSAVGKTVLYATAAATAFVSAVGATPQRDRSVEVTHIAAEPGYVSRSGSVTVPPDDTTISGSIEFKPWEIYPCWYGCSGSVTVTSGDLNPEPDIPSATTFTADMSFLFEDDQQTYDPDEDVDDSDIPSAFDSIPTADLSILLDDRSVEIVSLSGAERIEYDYIAAVPSKRLILNRPSFLSLARIYAGIPQTLFSIYTSALPSNAIPSNVLAQDEFLHFIPLTNGAIPSNAIPSNAIPSNLRISEAIPSNAIPDNYHSAIPSNYGLIYAIPSNMTRAQLLALGANAGRIPAAIPSNLTVADLRSYGIPSNAIPSNAIPSNAIPSNAIPSNAIPSNLVVLDLTASLLIDLPALGVEVALRPPTLLQSQFDFDQGVEIASLAGRVKGMSCDGSCVSTARVVADAQAVESELDLTSYVEVGRGTLLEYTLPGSDRVQLAYEIGYETAELPYRVGVETATVVGVETVEIGPRVGVEVVQIGASDYLCTEDLSGAYIWLGHIYNGDFAMRFTLGPSQNYQADSYQLSIDNQLTADCIIDPENPQLLQCIRDGIASRRWVDFVLRSQPASCEVFNESRYVCPVGESYHEANSLFAGGCCTDTCWCIRTDLGDTQPSCDNLCPGCSP